jgi:hypothetical protein
MVTFEEVLTQIYVVIEKILPVLFPFMAFILPPVIWLGQFMRLFIGESLYPYFPLDPAFQNLTPWYIIGGSVGLVALILLFIRPDRPEKDE